MALNPTDTKEYLYLYGNNSIRNNRFLLGRTDNEGATPLEVQTQVLARGTGSRPTNSRPRAKTIKVTGEIAIADLDLFEIEDLTRKLNRIYSEQYRMLRVVPSFITIADSSMFAQWTASDDAQNITQDTTEYQFSDRSIKFDINVAASANNFATLTGNLSTPVDISSLIDKGSIDFWLEIPDVYYVTSVDFRIGPDASNYWGYNFTTNYEGKSLVNGVNYFSCPFSKSSTPPCFVNRMTEIGTPTFAATDYVWIRINYSSSAVNINNCRFGEVFCVDERLVTNYLCYREGEVKMDRNWNYSARVRKYDLSLSNYVGFGQATHPKVAAQQSNITALSNTQLVDFEGSFEPAPVITMDLNSVTNLNNLTIRNLNNSELVQFTNTWSVGDKVTLDKFAEIDAQGRQPVRRNSSPQDFAGKIPSFNLGKNRLQLSITQSGNTQVNQNAYNADDQTSGFTKSAQSFVAPITGTLTVVQIPFFYSDYSNPSGVGNFAVEIRTNSGSAPSNTVVASGTMIVPQDNIFGWRTIVVNASVTSSVTYWLVVPHFTNTGPFGGATYEWAYNTSSVVTGNRSRFNGSWTAETNQDHAYRLTFEPTPSTNIDLSVIYTPLYA